MDFFERQERARKKTSLLVFYFLMAVVGIIAVLHIVLAMILGLDWRDPELLMWVAGGTLLVVTGGSVIKIMELSAGGRVVAAMLGGEPVSTHTTDPGQKRLLNIIEEMSIASGVPVPEVFLLPDPAINAFAAGHGPGDTAIGVTRGAVERLSRDELQGVIAHEFSHILHGDMRLNIQLMGLLNGILALAFLGGLLLRITFYMPSDGGGRGDRKGGGGVVLALLAMGVALYLIGWIGMFFGSLIKAAVSRQREFLADASAVQYTRNPDGIAGALWKIGKFTARLGSPRASEASHMFFGNGVGDSLFGLFATHPPLRERIAAIAPNFDESRVSSPPPVPQAEADAPPAAPNPPSMLFSRPAEPSLGFAAAMLAAIPEFGRSAAREIHSSCALVYALLLNSDPDARAVQLDGFAVSAGMLKESLTLFERRGEIAGAGRIALIDLSIPTLRQLSVEQYNEFRSNVRHLTEVDRSIDLFEFTLQKILLRHLDLYFTGSTGARVRHRSIIPLLPQIETLLTALALAGQSKASDQQDAFAAGVRELLFKPSSYSMRLGDATDIAALDSALDKLAEGSPEVKRTVLKACAQCVARDNTVTGHEYEILRAVADSLDCPMPPLPVDAD